MKLSKEKIKLMIQEEIVKIVEEEDMDTKIDKAKNAMKQEAANILAQIDTAAENMKMSPEMLKGFLIQFLNET